MPISYFYVSSKIQAQLRLFTPTFLALSFLQVVQSKIDDGLCARVCVCVCVCCVLYMRGLYT